jgi:hypothetical protein
MPSFFSDRPEAHRLTRNLWQLLSPHLSRSEDAFRFPEADDRRYALWHGHIAAAARTENAAI